MKRGIDVIFQKDYIFSGYSSANLLSGQVSLRLQIQPGDAAKLHPLVQSVLGSTYLCFVPVGLLLYLQFLVHRNQIRAGAAVLLLAVLAFLHWASRLYAVYLQNCHQEAYPYRHAPVPRQIRQTLWPV